MTKPATWLTGCCGLLAALTLFTPWTPDGDVGSAAFYQLVVGLCAWTLAAVVLTRGAAVAAPTAGARWLWVLVAYGLAVTWLCGRANDHQPVQWLVYGLYMVAVAPMWALSSARGRWLAAGLAALALAAELMVAWGQLAWTLAHGAPVTHVVGTLDNTTGAAMVALLLCGGMLAARRAAARPWERRLTTATAVAAALTVVVLQSRAGMLGLAVQVALLWDGGRAALRRLPRWARLGALLLVVVVAVGLYAMKRDSARGRVLIYRGALELVARQPIMGRGQGGFAADYMEVQARYLTTHPHSPLAMLADDVSQPMSDVLRYGVEYGLVGLALLFLIYVGALRQAWRARRQPAARCCLAVLGGVGAAATVSYPLTYPVVQWAVLTAAGVAWGLVPLAVPETPPRRRIAAAVAGTLLAAGCLVATVGQYVAVWQWARAYRHLAMGRTAAAMQQYGRVAPRLACHPAFIYNYAMAAGLADRPALSDSLLARYRRYGWNSMCALLAADNAVQQRQVARAMRLYGEAEAMRPVLFYPLYAMMRLQLQAGREAEARSLARVIIAKPVKVPTRQVADFKAEARALLEEKPEEGPQGNRPVEELNPNRR